MDQLKEKTAKGLMWGGLSNFLTQLLGVVIGIFLGRLLSPAEYGIVGVLTIFTVVAGNLQSSGFTQALINLKAPQHDDYNAVFWFNISASLIIYILLFLGAPLIAAYFGVPALTLVSRVTFIAIPISALGIVHNGYMMKNMMQRQLAVAGVLALVVSGVVGVAMAFGGCSYWSLVGQQIVYISVLNMVRMHYTRWRPTLPRTMQPVRRMWAFSCKMLLTNLINTFGQNLLTFVFGRMFTAGAAVGNYTQANKWNTMGSAALSGMLTQVAQTVLVSVGDERERELRVLRKMLRLTAMLSFPCLWGLALVAHEFIFITIGPKWADSALLLRVLCLGGAFLPIYTLYQNLVISRGRSDLYLWCNVAQLVGQIAVVLVFAKSGIVAVVWAYTVFSIAFFLVWQLVVRHLSGFRFRQMAADVLPFALAAAGALVVAGLVTAPISNLWLLFIARVVVASILYFVVLRVAHAQILDEALSFIRKKKE